MTVLTRGRFFMRLSCLRCCISFFVRFLGRLVGKEMVRLVCPVLFVLMLSLLLVLVFQMRLWVPGQLLWILWLLPLGWIPLVLWDLSGRLGIVLAVLSVIRDGAILFFLMFPWIVGGSGIGCFWRFSPFLLLGFFGWLFALLPG